MKLDNNQQALFALVRAGFWETEVQLAPFEKIDYQEVYSLAEEQSVVGLVTAGFDHVVDVKVPQEELLQFVGSSLQLEQTNLTMNGFIAQLIKKLCQNGIYALLVKGQGIAQCYERPLWRTSGDVDLLLDTDNYIKAKAYCDTIADSYSLDTKKNKERLHQEYQMGDWTVELHGTMHADLSRRMDCVIDQVQDETFSKKQVRVWKNGDTDVALPSPDNDVIFVFSHILQHLFFEGIGLRQICDWCRLLWTYKDSLNRGLLESRIRAMGVMSEWKVLAAFAVKYLGIPADAMPLYSEEPKWKRKADRICSFIMEVGNFGHNREVEWNNPFKRRSMLIWHRITDTISLSFVFPVDAPKFLVKYACDGVKYLVLESRGGK
jgi:hypothetical protein